MSARASNPLVRLLGCNFLFLECFPGGGCGFSSQKRPICARDDPWVSFVPRRCSGAFRGATASEHFGHVLSLLPCRFFAHWFRLKSLARVELCVFYAPRAHLPPSFFDFPLHFRTRAV
jgi:hypothetical protein